MSPHRIAATLALAGCASVPPRPSSSTTSRIDFPGFSFASPGPSWSPSSAAEDGLIMVLRREAAGAAAQTHSLLAWAATRDLSGLNFDGDEAALQFEDDMVKASRPFLSFRIVSHKTEAARAGAGRCVRYELVMQSLTGTPLLEVTRGIRCLHPKWLRRTVTLGISETRPLADAPAVSPDETEAFLASLAFADHRPISVTRTRLEHGATGVVIAKGSAWIAMGDRVSRVDLQTGRELAVIPTGRKQFPGGGIVADASSIWVATGENATVVRIDSRTNEVTATIGAGGDLRSIAICDGSPWVANYREGEILRVDPQSEEIAARIPVGNDPSAIACDQSSLWVACRGSDTVVRVDLRSAQVAQRIKVGQQPTGMALSGGRLWVVNEHDSTLSQIDAATGQVEATSPLGGHAGPIAAGEGALWLEVQSATVRIDPRTAERIQPLWPGTIGRALAVSGSTVWLAGLLELVRVDF